MIMRTQKKYHLKKSTLNLATGIVFFLFIFNLSYSQTFNIDSTFNLDDNCVYQNGFGFNNRVLATTIQQDGKILVGGSFTSFNNSNIHNRMARLNPDGTIDNTFNLGFGFNDEVYSIVCQSDGKILVAGKFTSFSANTQNRIVRLNQDGSIDPSFNIGSGFNDQVNCLLIQPDGKIIAGGSFTTYNGTTANRIVRLNSNGTIDNTFLTGSGFTGIVRSIVLQTDGRIIAGGSFAMYNGNNCSRIARLNSNGSFDFSFMIGSGFTQGSWQVNALILQSNGAIIVGGSFTTYNSLPANNIARLNTNGALDNSYNNSTGYTSVVNALTVQPDGKVIVNFSNGTWYNGISLNTATCRLNQNGTLDNSFTLLYNQFYVSGGNNSISIQSDGKIIIGWELGSGYGSLYSLVRINTNGSLDPSFFKGSGFNGSIVRDIIVQNDNKILVAGDFTTYNGEPIQNITRLESNGERDLSFTPQFNNAYDVPAIALQLDGKILASSYNQLKRLNTDGSTDNTFISSTHNGGVEDVEIQQDGKVIVGGSMTQWNGLAINNLVRLNTDGTIDGTFFPGIVLNQPQVKKILIQPDQKIIIVCQSIILRLNSNGSIDNSFNLDANAIGGFTSACLQPDGKILIAGSSNIHGVARLMPNGDLDPTFDASSSSGTAANIYSIAVQNNGKIILGGDIFYFQGITNSEIVRVNADGSIDLSFNVSTNPPVSSPVHIKAIYLKNSDTLIIGGRFSSINNLCRTNIARLINNCSTPPLAPQGNSSQSFCNSATISDLVANGSQIQWYSTTTGGTPLNGNTNLVNNTTYYASQTIGGCESQDRLAVTVILNSNPSSSVTSTGGTLTSDQSGANYQWLNCNSNFTPISGANQVFFTPTLTGNYAVEVTQNGCSVISDCYLVNVSSVGLNGASNSNEVINLYPNPNNGSFTLETSKPGKYIVLDGIGKQIFEFDVESTKNDVHIPNISKGIYYIMYFEEKSNPIKLIVH